MKDYISLMTFVLICIAILIAGLSLQTIATRLDRMELKAHNHGKCTSCGSETLLQIWESK